MQVGCLQWLFSNWVADLEKLITSAALSHIHEPLHKWSELGCGSREKWGVSRALASFQFLASTLGQVGQAPLSALFGQYKTTAGRKAALLQSPLQSMSTLALLAHHSYRCCHIFSYPTDSACRESSHNSCCYEAREKIGLQRHCASQITFTCAFYGTESSSMGTFAVMKICSWQL